MGEFTLFECKRSDYHHPQLFQGIENQLFLSASYKIIFISVLSSAQNFYFLKFMNKYLDIMKGP